MFSQFVINILIGAICYFIFEKYNLQYNLENGLIAILSIVVMNKLVKKVEGFEDGEDMPLMESPEMEEPSMDEPLMEMPSMESPEMETQPMESPEQENSPSMTEDIVEEISMEEPSMESPQMEEPSMESPQMEEPSMESPQMEEPSMEEPSMESSVSEESQKPKESSEITPYTSEELKKLQSKYTIMPVESWIKNEISLMSKSQQEASKSCMCPTLSRASNDYLEF